MEGCPLSSPWSGLAFWGPPIGEQGQALGLMAWGGCGCLCMVMHPFLGIKRGTGWGETPCLQHRGFTWGWEEHWQDAAPWWLCGMADVAVPRL